MYFPYEPPRSAPSVSGSLAYDMVDIRDLISLEIPPGSAPLQRQERNAQFIHLRPITAPRPVRHKPTENVPRAPVPLLPVLSPGSDRPSSAGMYFCPKVTPPSDICHGVETFKVARQRKATARHSADVMRFQDTILRVVHNSFLPFIDLPLEADVVADPGDEEDVVAPEATMTFKAFKEAMMTLEVTDISIVRALFQKFNNEKIKDLPKSAASAKIPPLVPSLTKKLAATALSSKPSVLPSDESDDTSLLLYVKFMDALLTFVTSAPCAQYCFGLFDPSGVGVIRHKELCTWRRFKIPASIGGLCNAACVKSVLNLFDVVQTQELNDYFEATQGKKGKKKKKGGAVVALNPHEILPGHFRRSDVIGRKYFASQFAINGKLICDLLPIILPQMYTA